MTKPNVRFFVCCPRGFVNERTVMASDDDRVIQAMHRKHDDGMAGTFEEVDEREAKRLLYGSKAEPAIETAIHNSDKEYEVYPKWENLLYFLLLNSKLEYDY